MLFYLKYFSDLRSVFSPPFHFLKKGRLTAIKVNQEKPGAPRNDFSAGTTRGNKSLTEKIIHENISRFLLVQT